MSYQQRIFPRYSDAFKRKVVSEIESGQLSLSQARRVYDIHGGGTIQKWIEKLGKSQLLNKVIRIEMKDENDRIKELERQKQALESALAQAQLRILSLESLIKVSEEYYGINVKKNSELSASGKL